MGKWSELIKGRERLPVEGGDKYQLRVDEKKTELLQDGPMTSVQLAPLYRRLRDERDKLEEVRSDLDCRIVAVTQMLVDALEHDGLESLKMTDGSTVRAEPEPYASAEDVEAVRSWAVQRGLESKLSLPWQTLNSEVKKALEAGEPDPPGVKIFFRTKLVLSGR